ncbi:MAG: putative toxin-antitoxin system toxin component, PIN family [Candidatus Binatia bacterium]
MKPVVLLDTNVWVSAFLNKQGPPARLVEAWLNREIDVVIALSILEEIGDVLRRPRIKRKYQVLEEDVVQYLRLIAAGVAVVPVAGTMRLCRDPDDDVVLETAIAGGAKYLVTRDDDLKRDLDLIRQMKEHGVQVMSVSRFLATV